MGAIETPRFPNILLLYSFEHHHELAPRQFDTRRAARGLGERDAERALLQPLHPDGEAVAVPPEDLEAVAAARAEDEEVTRQRVVAEGLAHERGERVEALAHVAGLDGEEDPDWGGQREHGAARSSIGQATSASTMRRSSTGSAPSATRSVMPRGTESSKAASVARPITCVDSSRGESSTNGDAELGASASLAWRRHE